MLVASCNDDARDALAKDGVVRFSIRGHVQRCWYLLQRKRQHPVINSNGSIVRIDVTVKYLISAQVKLSAPHLVSASRAVVD